MPYFLKWTQYFYINDEYEIHNKFHIHHLYKVMYSVRK